MIFVFEAVGLRPEGFLRHERALKQGLCLLPGRLLASPAVETNCFVALIQLSLGRLLLSRACFCFTGQIDLACWRWRLFPVSVSLGVYRVGNGKGPFDLVTSGVAADLPECG